MTKITSFDAIPQFTRDGSYQADFSPQDMLGFIDRQVTEHGLIIDPDFQRGHVWTKAQQVAYIEFFLRGGKTGRVIYLNDPNWMNFRVTTKPGDFVLVDGKQRIHAWRRFLTNEIKAFGSYFREFTDQIHPMTQTMKINVNNLGTRKQVLQWYVDFNSGGTVHSKQEIERVRELIALEG